MTLTASAARTGATPAVGPALEPGRLLAARVDASRAIDLIAPYYGLDAAIAVNPLLPSLGAGLARAVDVAAEFGARPLGDLRRFRDLARAGRISAIALERALDEAVDRTGDGHPRHPPSDGGSLGPVDRRGLLLADLLEGPDAPAPVVPHFGRRVEEESSRWARAVFAAEEATWPVPVQQLGYAGAWRALAAVQPGLGRRARRRIRSLPADGAAMLVVALDRLGVSDDHRAAYLRRHVAAQPGWFAAARWRASTRGDIAPLDLLAVRVALHSATTRDGRADRRENSDERMSLDARRTEWLRERFGLPAARTLAVADAIAELPHARRLLVWQRALEFAPHDAVLGMVRPTAGPPVEARTAAAQLMFCIDPRSEGIRRHLEARGAYETLGFAGFFGVAVRATPLGASVADDSCPVLISPRVEVAEVPVPGASPLVLSALREVRRRQTLGAAVAAADAVPAAPFGWAEISGWARGPLAALRSLAAGRGPGPSRPGDELAAIPVMADVDSGIPPEEQIDTAEVALRTMGLTRAFAPLLLLVGHGTSTSNNAFRTALDCGACGGHRGAPNARALAALLRSPVVIAGLAERGIHLPATTLVLAAEHDTATDRVVLLDSHVVPPERAAELDALRADLALAGTALAGDRVRDLPGSPATALADPEAARRHVRHRAADWAQVYPEWGLAGCAAIVIGPRAATRGADLGRRVFLHSYDAPADTDGVVLETILTAPLVVAHWITAQYASSTADPARLGAGTKTTHNPVGGTGVVTGPGGDLRLGLPWQSVGTRAGSVHEPVRLLAVVLAPRDRVERIIRSATVVDEMATGEWITLVVPGDDQGTWWRWDRGAWVPWSDAPVPITRTPRTEEAA